MLNRSSAEEPFAFHAHADRDIRSAVSRHADRGVHGAPCPRSDSAYASRDAYGPVVVNSRRFSRSQHEQMKIFFASLRLCGIFLLCRSRPRPRRYRRQRTSSGWTPGDDRKLASWAAVVEYFQKLDAASDRVKFRGDRQNDNGRSVCLRDDLSAGESEESRKVQTDQRQACGPANDSERRHPCRHAT